MREINWIISCEKFFDQQTFVLIDTSNLSVLVPSHLVLFSRNMVQKTMKNLRKMRSGFKMNEAIGFSKVAFFKKKKKNLVIQMATSVA